MRGSEVLLLDADQELAHMLGEAEAAAARASVRATTRVLPRGSWDAAGEYGDDSGWLGLLVLDGFLARETLCGEDVALEVIGPGDLLRPWDHDGEYPLAKVQTRWKVLESARLAELDARCAETIARWPALAAAILGRSGRRARWLAGSLAISSHPRTVVRIADLFRQLAQRWGRRQGEVAVLPLRLTHEEIAGLIGTNRPSVTVALGQMRDEGRLVRTEDGWSISAGAPAPLEQA